MSMLTFEGRIVFGTQKAILFQGHYWHAPEWLPRSASTIKPDGEDTVVIGIAAWLCRKNGFNEFEELHNEPEPESGTETSDTSS